MSRSFLVPTIIAGVIGLAGLLLVLFAWHLPPFAPSAPTTENAYLRGRVTTISPQLSGYIAKVEVQDFQEVHEGDVIAVLDDRIYRQKLAQAEAGLAGAKAAMEVAVQNVRSAEAVLKSDAAALASADLAVQTARSDNSRTTSLRERGVATEAALEQTGLALQKALTAQTQAQATMDVQREQLANAKVQIASAQAQIDNANAAVELTRIDLGNTVIRAPAAGKLGQIAVRVGQYVSPGTALVSHVGQDLWLIANFNESSLNSLAVGQKVRFSVDALHGQVFTGVIESFSPATASEFSLIAGTNATGNFTKIAQRVPVRIRIDPGQAQAGLLAPGFSVVASVQPD
ncbi:HlyD family secretion protein [Paracoccus sp. IB05]|uniref:HlyD family secretion protein n=1 Tax=Paracoccus sp. IB05 TaxID=2779367 RepID=UPI0018E7FB48|nr:HlyD family secretion protein [Paracoccus sp. IB05]MBJ2151609.1 HlyD family secretion protein [Paracoccus sp. IB05]